MDTFAILWHSTSERCSELLQIKRSLQLPCQEKKGKTLAKTGTELHTSRKFKSESRTKIVPLAITHVCGTLRSFRNSFTIVTEDDRGFRFNQTFTIFRCIELFFDSIILD